MAVVFGGYGTGKNRGFDALCSGGRRRNSDRAEQGGDTNEPESGYGKSQDGHRRLAYQSHLAHNSPK